MQAILASSASSLLVNSTGLKKDFMQVKKEVDPITGKVREDKPVWDQ